MNFEQGKILADRQQRVFECIDRPSEIDVKRLRENLWVKAATKLAPSNLVVRHYCLLDILDKKNNNINTIIEQLSLLAPDLWVEGYSYWVYTKPFLVKYVERVRLHDYQMSYITETIEKVDKAFICSAYYDNNQVLRPAPFGDLRMTMIEDQTGKPEPSCKFKFIEKLTYSKSGSSCLYIVDDYPVGLNTHCPKKMKITVLNGYCYNFKFYDGYDKKYNNKLEEIGDVLAIDRIVSLFKR